MVEFALVGPLGFLLLLGILVVGIVILTQVQLTNAVRDGARAAAVCGSNPTATTTLPNSTTCSTSNITAYITSQITALHSNVAPATMTVLDTSGTSVGTTTASCVKGYTVRVNATYNQPLFLPLVGTFFGNGATNTRTINVQAEATCEQ